MRKIFTSILMLFVCVFFAGLVVAADKATKDECVAKCKEAATMVKEKGVEATLDAIKDRNGPFVWKDTYVFCIDVESGKMLAHPIKPKLIGKMLMGIKDTNGKMFFVEYVNKAKSKGEGWVDYMWPKPGEKKSSPKLSYIYRVPGENLVMIAGIYK